MIRKVIERVLTKNKIPNAISNFEFLKVQLHRRFRSGKTKIFDKEFCFSDNMGFLHSLEEIFKEQVYKFECSNKEPFIIDAGANMGLSIIYFKQLFPNAKIVAFEPDASIFKLLTKNIDSFKFKNVELKNSAVWTEDTDLEFFSEGSLAGSLKIDLDNKKNKYTVKAESLKKWLTNTKVDFLKIDIEGAENSVIFDIEHELSNVDTLFLEYHSMVGQDQKLGAMLDLVNRAGFRYYIRSAADPLNYPFIDRLERGFDLQLNIFCFRL